MEQPNNSKFDKQKTIDRYQYSCNDVIGRGAYAIVYAGRSLKTNERVAIKVMDKLKFADEYCLKSVQSEIDIMKKMLHPNVVQLLDVYQTKCHIYIVTEFCE
jgi:serine/threonine protein kinase